MTTLYFDAVPLFAPVLFSIAGLLVASVAALAWLGWHERTVEHGAATVRERWLRSSAMPTAS